jgi:hypothetical protein
MPAPVALAPVLIPLLTDAIAIAGAASVYILAKPANAPTAPPLAPKPVPKNTGLNNGPAYTTAPINVTNTTTNINIYPPTVSPGTRVVYVPEPGGRKRPVVNINIKKPPSIPPRKLPAAGDGQDNTKTKRKPSITVSKALENDKFGKLLGVPITTKKEKIVEIVGGDISAKVVAASQKNTENFSLWLAQQTGALQPADREKLKKMGGSVPYWDATALIMPQFLSGFDGEIGFVYGLEPLHEIASYCRDTAVNARQEVTGWIPKELEVKQQVSKAERSYKEPNNAKITNTGINGVATALEFDWAMEATPEEILKGFGLMQFSKEGTQDDFEENLTKALKENKFEEFFKGISEATDGNRLQVRNLPRLLGLLSSASFFRAGYHRLPQDYPEYLVKDKAELIKKKDSQTPLIQLADALEIQDWQSRQLDAWFGEWATTITVKSQDGKKDEQIHLPNLAEAIAEMFTLLFNVNLLSEHTTQIQIKQMAELAKLFNQGLLTYDHAVAISKFLGYSGETKTEEIPLPYDPKADDLIDFQKPSTAEVVRWENVDKSVVKEDLTAINISAARAASAVWNKWRPGEPLPGERIKREREREKELADKQWEKWIKSRNIPSGYEKTDAKPRPIIDNVPIADNQDDY